VVEVGGGYEEEVVWSHGADCGHFEGFGCSDELQWQVVVVLEEGCGTGVMRGAGGLA
jgi:hypothetical protein